jgi:hypothetical protein
MKANNWLIFGIKPKNEIIAEIFQIKTKNEIIVEISD